jgi:branched-chain amino acid transport system permease protein
MTGLLTGSLAGAQFQVFTSLLIVALVYIGGVARISGAVVAGLFFVPKGFGPTLLDEWFGIGEYAVLIGGLGLILTAILEPDGLSLRFEHLLRSLWRRVRRRGITSPGELTVDRPVGEPRRVEVPS